MDLLQIFEKIWRYKFLTVPVLLATLVFAVYEAAIKDPEYEAQASYLLLNPPPPPTPDEIARDPSLGHVNANNPYARFSDPSVPISVLSSVLGSEASRRRLERAGADPRYEVRPRVAFASTPIIEVVGEGRSAREAIRTTDLVGNAMVAKLNRMQAEQGVDPGYRITTRQISVPDHAILKASGALRTLIAVLAAGGVLLFLIVSAADALSSMRATRRERRLEGLDDTWPPVGELTDTSFELDRDGMTAQNGGLPMDVFDSGAESPR